VKTYATAGLVLLAFAGLTGEAVSQDIAKTSATPWYVGLGVGRTFARVPQESIDGDASSIATLFGGTVVDTNSDTSNSTEGKVFLGYKFDRHVAIEVGYATLGKASASALISNGITFQVLNLEYKMSAPFVDAVGTLPLDEKWSLIGRVGIAYARTSASDSFGGGTSETKLREKFGAGVDYNLNSAFTVRAEWENYRMPDPLTDNSFRINAAVLSGLFHF
jgi:OmpA-OmpF porin, OOP family